MNRIIAERGMAKTESLYSYAESLAKQCPDKKVYFVALSFPSAERIAERHRNAPENLHFTCHAALQSTLKGVRDYYLVIDELDSLLERFHVTGYSTTIGE